MLTAVEVYILQRWAHASFLEWVRAFHSRSSAFKSNARRWQMTEQPQLVYRATVLYFESTISQFISSTCSGQSVTSECTTYNSWQSCYFECLPWSISTVLRGSLFTSETWQYMHAHKNTQTLFLISCPSVFIVCSKQLAFLKGVQTTDR